MMTDRIEAERATLAVPAGAVSVRFGPCVHAWIQQPTTGTWSCLKCPEIRRYDQPPAMLATAPSAPTERADQAALLREQLRQAEESRDRLRLILARYGDRVPMATCRTEGWQEEIDEALSFAVGKVRPFVDAPTERATGEELREALEWIWAKHRAHSSARPDYRQGWNDAVAVIAKHLEALASTPAGKGATGEVEEAAARIAAADGRDWSQHCLHEADPETSDLCDSDTCVAALFEDHDPDHARETYRRYARAALGTAGGADGGEVSA